MILRVLDWLFWEIYALAVQPLTVLRAWRYFPRDLWRALVACLAHAYYVRRFGPTCEACRRPLEMIFAKRFLDPRAYRLCRWHGEAFSRQLRERCAD